MAVCIKSKSTCSDCTAIKSACALRSQAPFLQVRKEYAEVLSGEESKVLAFSSFNELLLLVDRRRFITDLLFCALGGVAGRG